MCGLADSGRPSKEMFISKATKSVDSSSGSTSAHPGVLEIRAFAASKSNLGYGERFMIKLLHKGVRIFYTGPTLLRGFTLKWALLTVRSVRYCHGAIR